MSWVNAKPCAVVNYPRASKSSPINKIQITKIHMLTSVFSIFLPSLVIFTAALTIVNNCLPNRYDADLVVYSMMSLEHKALFYWGQDRLIALIPWLASPWQDPGNNINVIKILNSLSFVVSLSIAYIFLNRNIVLHEPKKPNLSLYLGLGISLLLFCSFLQVHELFDFAKHAQPYSISFLTGIIGISILKLTSKENKATKRVITYILTTLSYTFIFLSVGLAANTAYFILFCFAVLEIKGSKLSQVQKPLLNLLLTLISTILIWKVITLLSISADYSANYFNLNKDGIFKSLYYSATAIISGRSALSWSIVGFIVIIPIIILLSSFLAFNKAYGYKSFPTLGNYFYFWTSGALFSITSFILTSQLDWVRLNLYGHRYQFSLFFGLFICLSANIVLIIELLNITLAKLMPKLTLYPDYIPNLLSIFLISILMILSYSNIKNLPRIYDYDSMKSAFEVYEVAKSENIGIISGNYWINWPTQLYSIVESRKATSSSSTTFNLTTIAYRAEGNHTRYFSSQEMAKSQLSDSGFYNILCVHSNEQEIEDCKNQSLRFLSLSSEECNKLSCISFLKTLNSEEFMYLDNSLSILRISSVKS